MCLQQHEHREYVQQQQLLSCALQRAAVVPRALAAYRYKTTLCNLGGKCDRDICFFAHRWVAVGNMVGSSDSSSEARGRWLYCYGSMGSIIALIVK